MSMVSLTIAPLISGKEDWESWYFGLVPLAIFVVITVVLVYMKVLTWKDPLQNLSGASAKVVEAEAPSSTAGATAEGRGEVPVEV